MMDKKRKLSKLSMIAGILTIIVLIQYLFPFLTYFQESINPNAWGRGFYWVLANFSFYFSNILDISIIIISILSIIFIKKYRLKGLTISIICLTVASLELIAELMLIVLLSGLS